MIPGNSRHQGSRKEQQDDFGFSDIDNPIFVRHGGILAVVTDGMGGMALGKEAAYVGKKTMLATYQDKSMDESIPDALHRSLFAANESVVSLAQDAGKENQVGTTLAAAVVHLDRLHWIAAGDSRIYLYRNQTLTQLTRDHVYGHLLDALAEAGEISPEEARSHPDRDALSSGLGWEPLDEVDQSETPVPLMEGDRIFLCSDGIYKTLSESEIANLLSGHPQQAADALIHEVLSKNRPGQDNMTAVILGRVPEGQTTIIELHSPKKRRGRPLLVGLLVVFLVLLGLVAVVRYQGDESGFRLPFLAKPSPAVTDLPGKVPALAPPVTGYEPPNTKQP